MFIYQIQNTGEFEPIHENKTGIKLIMVRRVRIILGIRPGRSSRSRSSFLIFLVSLWRFSDLDEDSVAISCMLTPPSIIWARCTIHGSFDKTKEGMPKATWSVTLPPMLLVVSHFVMEGMVDLQGNNSLLLC